LKKLFRYIFVGILSLAPLFIVIKLLLWANSLSVDLFSFVSEYTHNSFYTVITFVLLTATFAFVGYSIEKVGKSLLISTIDNIIDQVPAIGNIYTIIKKVTSLFTHSSKDAHRDVVLVQYPKDDIWVPAYVLNEHEAVLVLFIPTSPNPTSGYTVIIERTKVIKTSYTIGEVSQFIISMGADFVKEDEITRLIKEYNDRQ